MQDVVKLLEEPFQQTASSRLETFSLIANKKWHVEQMKKKR